MPLAAGEDFYRFDGVVIDCGNFRVEKDGQEITLTPRAFDVLVFLARHSGRVVEKQELFDSVWRSSFVSDNALTKVIKEIRQALRDPADQPRYIETVPKRGYRFIAGVNTQPTILNGTTQDIQQVVHQRKRDGGQWTYLIISCAGLVLLGLAGFAYMKLKSLPDSAPPIGSIAVLPFENASKAEDLEYLSDGITEQLINSLSRQRRLRVTPRTSVFYYKDRRADPRTIGRTLNVRSVLTGKIVLRGEMLTIQTELIDVERQAQIWGEQYTRPLADLFKVPDSIAREIITNLRFQLPDREQLTRYHTNNSDAYRWYLQGHFYWNKRTVKDLEKSIECFSRAVAADPNYGMAFAALANAYSQLANYGGAPPREAMPKAKEAVLKALTLDERLSEAHNALGFILMCYDFEFGAAEREFKRAIELDPNNAMAHQFYGNLLMYLGRSEEASGQYALALELDPLSLILNRMYGESLFYARRYDAAVAQYKKTLDLDVNFASAHFSLSVAHQLQGHYPEAVEEFAKSQELINQQLLATRAREGFARGGWKGYLQVMTRTEDLPGYTVAAFHTSLGENDKAVAKLEQAYERREHFVIWTKVDPRLDPLRGDPRFQRLLERIGFTP
jgi:TolB-like protein/DNA-binding winged helix-turn-helix (wHTH) protein/Tfp pilus assembly protein PilF